MFTYTACIQTNPIAMSQNQFKNAVISEIENLNALIDKKILRGLDYHKESSRHKQLLRTLRRFDSRKVFGFSKVFSFINFI